MTTLADIKFDTIVVVTPVDTYRAEAYGIAHESVSLHKIKGQNIHNRGFNHKIQVWNNRDGKNPRGKETTDARWISTSAQASMLTSGRGIPLTYGDDITIGDRVALVVSDDDGVRILGVFELTNQFLADPILIPADDAARAAVQGA